MWPCSPHREIKVGSPFHNGKQLTYEQEIQITTKNMMTTWHSILENID